MSPVGFVRCFSILLVLGLSHAAILRGRADKKYFSLEDLMPANSKISQKSFNGTWISENEILYKTIESEDLFILDVINSSLVKVITASQLLSLNTTDVKISPDKKIVLARSDPETGFRYSSSARYTLYDIAKNETVDIAQHRRLQYCAFSGEGHSLAYVLDNDVYYKADMAAVDLRVTHDGVPGVIYNGVPDWVYEEEVFGSGSALWFSPQKNFLALASFNDTNVDEVVYFTYGLPGSIEDQYPKMWPLKYPKAGRTNPTVALRVSNLAEGGAMVTLEAPAELGAEPILGTVTWASDTELAALWLNRRQNSSVLIVCSVITSACNKLVVREEPAGWIDVTTPLFSKDGVTFVDIVPQPPGDGANDEWFHVAQYTRSPDGATDPAPLSQGRRTAISLVGWNQELDLIYYLSTREDLPWERHLYVTGSRSACVSCAVVLPTGAPCSYASAVGPPGMTHYTLTCQTSDTPAMVAIFESKTDLQIIEWQTNEALTALLEEYYLPQQRFLFVPVPGGRATVKFFLPPELSLENPGDTKFPMVVNIYTGPNSARVIENFGLSYQTYMSTNRSIIYCYVEGRGSGLKGKDSLFSINNRLGTHEIEDVINVTRTLTELYPWIDASRVGLWGWSYGGYATGMALTKDTGHVFRCGVSVAPVTSWLYYDSIYTERYMGLPTKEDNAEGYSSSDMTRSAGLLAGHHWLLMHGNADDNVHYQNAMAISRALQELDIPFEQMSYPDEAHGLNGVTRHVYHTIDNFWTRCFAPGNSTTFAFG